MAGRTAVILAGGQGTRLAPYTTVLPKPLMPVGDLPILEVVLRQLRVHGFKRIVIAVGHLSELIMAFFGDGSKWGVNITYAIEDEPLGTVGPLRTIEGLDRPFLVMNGDLLTNINYAELYDYHQSGEQLATVATARREVNISLGVIEYDSERRITDFQEKPTHTYSVSMGIYVFDPAIIRIIPEDQPYGFDHLMSDMLASKQPIQVFPFDDLWLDIGRREDYEAAYEVFRQHREKFIYPEPADSEPS